MPGYSKKEIKTKDVFIIPEKRARLI